MAAVSALVMLRIIALYNRQHDMRWYLDDSCSRQVFAAKRRQFLQEEAEKVDVQIKSREE
uniref:Uncharacterized protein n=1 Tax=Hyaloperonospora arabidopsidis (strain Emoy2) TaxID=559515 RepID=M4BBY8_HYAAE